MGAGGLSSGSILKGRYICFGGLSLPACLVKSEGFYPSWVSSVDGVKGLVGLGVWLVVGCLGDDLGHASKGLDSFTCRCSADGHMGCR